MYNLLDELDYAEIVRDRHLCSYTSGPSTKTSNVSNTSTTPVLPSGEPDLADLAHKLGSLGNSLVPGSLPGYQPLTSGPLNKPDSYMVPFTDQQNYLMQQATGQLLGQHPGEAAVGNYYANEVNGNSLDPSKNVGLQQQLDALRQNTSNQLNIDVGSTLARAGQAGASGGSRQALMLGQALGDANRGFATASGNLLGDAYKTNRLLQSNAAAALPGIEAGPTTRTLNALDLSGAPQQLAQQERNAQLAELQGARDAQYQPIQIAQSLLGQRLGETIPIVSPGQSPLTGLSSLAGGLGNLFSGIGRLGSIGGGPNSTTTGGSSSSGSFGSLGSGLTSIWNSIFGNG